MGVSYEKIIADRYELTTCTAVAASIGDDTRQPAVFYHDVQDANHDGDAVIFGCSLDDIDSSDDLAAIDASAFSTDADDLETVDLFVNYDYETPFNAYDSTMMQVLLSEENFIPHVVIDILKGIQSDYEHKLLNEAHYLELLGRIFKAGSNFFSES